MTTLRTLPAGLQDLFGIVAKQLAKDTDFIVRERQLHADTFLTTVVFGYLHDARIPLQTLAAQLELSESALHQQCAKPEAAAFLAAALRTALTYAFQPPPQHRVTQLPALRAFHGVYATDATTLPLPACLHERYPGCANTPDTPQATLKILVTYELDTGRLHSLQLYAGKDADNGLPWDAADLPKGSLHLTDLGFFQRDRLRAEDAHGIDWISRLSCNHALRLAGTGKDAIVKLVPFLEARQRAVGRTGRIDVPVLVGSVYEDAPLAARLVAWEVPRTMRRQREQEVKRRASRKGQRVSAAMLALCRWLVFITNLTDPDLTPPQVGELYRLRWQIELLFKRWKSVLETAVPSRKRTAGLALVEVYARLLGAVVSSWWECQRSGPLAVPLTGVLNVWRCWSQRLAECLRRGDDVSEVLARLDMELRCLPRPRRRSGTRVYARLRLYFTVNVA